MFVELFFASTKHEKKNFFWEHKNRIHVDKYANINFASFYFLLAHSTWKKSRKILTLLFFALGHKSATT